MNNLGKTHPGARKEIKQFCLLVCRNNFDENAMQSVDMDGE